MVYTYLKFGLLALTLLFGFAAFAVKPKRRVLGWAAASAAVGAACAHYQVFWLLALCVMMIPWALFCAGEWIDSGWRAKVGFCIFLLVGSALCLYPTYVDERFGRPDVDPKLSEEQQAEVDARAAAGELGFGRFIRANVPFRLVRGLDLKGGFRVEYTVDAQEAVKDRRDRYYDDIRTHLARSLGVVEGDAYITNEMLAKLGERVVVEKPRDDVSKIVLKFQAPEDTSKVNNEFLARFIHEMNVLRGSDPKIVTFQIKSEVIEQIKADSVAQAKDKIHRRIDSMGVKEAAIASRGDDIIIEVPGDDHRQFNEIKSIIGQTARLEFKMLDDAADFFGEMAKGFLADPGHYPMLQEQGITFGLENAPLGPNKTEPRYYARIEKRPGEPTNDTLKRFKEWTQTLEVPSDRQIVFGKIVEFDREKALFEEKGWRTYYVSSRAEVVGDMIRAAGAERDPSDARGNWQVGLEFTPVGADRFEEVTGANVNKRFAIILDEIVESAPVIRQKIAGGRAVITMGDDNPAEQLEDAKRLALVIKSGALPAPIEYKNQQQVGPTLGADAIEQGLKGALLSGVLVIVFMMIIYSRAGLIANVAVVFNLILQVSILAMFGAALTLPGIAGLALTIGIAVDANVLINERIRDELRAGKSPRQAVDVGYDRAFSAIIDGHMTTLISGLILFQYGSGPIKGFAVALIIGMVSSLFTGVVCTRLMFDYAVRWRKVKQLSLG